MRGLGGDTGLPVQPRFCDWERDRRGVVLAFVTYESFRKRFVLCREVMDEPNALGALRLRLAAGLAACCANAETNARCGRAVQTQKRMQGVGFSQK